SPHAHARIKRIDTTRAKGAPGVLAVYTGADTAGVLKPMPCAWLIPNSNLKVAEYPVMARDVVHYVGDVVAVVVAKTAYQAFDAEEQNVVDYPAVGVAGVRETAAASMAV